jgi:8-oxo-dGTP pyrophosphatase MutT (NUDIX family)
MTEFTPAPLTKKERALRDALPRPARPKKAATLILWKGPRDNPRILMGRRAIRHDFMPSVYVFPGGRVDRADSYAGWAGRLSARTQNILEAAYSPRAARAVALAAVRETYEETSLMLGEVGRAARNPRNASYQAFYSAGQQPDISGLEVIGRAITPPRRHKRFDTWFFAKDMNAAGPHAPRDSHELLNVGWFSYEEIETLKTHVATETMINVLQRFLAQDTPPQQIFFMRRKGARFITDAFPDKGVKKDRE